MDTASAVVVPATQLRSLMSEILRGMGCEEKEAAEVADHLVEANLKGHDSHGIGMIAHYTSNFHAGKLHPNKHARLVRHDGPFAVFDGDMGFGQVIAREAMDWAIMTARAGGIAIAGLRNTHHIGRVGTYGEHVAAAGLVFVGFVNARTGPPFVAPFGGSDGRMSTNPICIAIPGADGTAPIVLDFATSVVAMGKVRVAYNKRQQMPEGYLIDAKGQPTTNPGVLWPDRSQGAILPFGAHKGSGLALVCELLAGALLGGGSNQPEHVRDVAIINSMFTFVFDPARMNELPAFHHEMQAMIEFAKGSPPSNPDEPVLVAGEPEIISRERRLREGIPIDSNTWRELTESAASLGVSRERVERATK